MTSHSGAGSTPRSAIRAVPAQPTAVKHSTAGRGPGRPQSEQQCAAAEGGAVGDGEQGRGGGQAQGRRQPESDERQPPGHGDGHGQRHHPGSLLPARTRLVQPIRSAVSAGTGEGGPEEGAPGEATPRQDVPCADATSARRGARTAADRQVRRPREVVVCPNGRFCVARSKGHDCSHEAPAHQPRLRRHRVRPASPARTCTPPSSTGSTNTPATCRGGAPRPGRGG